MKESTILHSHMDIPKSLQQLQLIKSEYGMPLIDKNF